MGNINDELENLSEEDLKELQSELSPSEGKTEAVSSTENKTTGEASPQSTDKQSGKSEGESESKEETKSPASEGEKTPPVEVTLREKKTSQYVPYERFKEVNDRLKELERQLSQNRPSPPVYNELENWEQPQPQLEEVINQKVAEKIKEVVEPIVVILDEDRERKEFESALAKYPEAKKYLNEIEAYGKATNLTYEDIATLVLAKHSSFVSPQEAAMAEEESREAGISGKSNSTAKRNLSPKDVKSLSDEELEKLIEG